MKITQIEVHRVDLAYAGGVYRLSGGREYRSFDATIATDACDGVGLKISKQGGLTASQRQRAIASAAGLVMSVQDTTGSEIAFAAILHLAQSTPRHLLRCALDPRSMVSTRIAAFDAPIVEGGAHAPELAGLGVTPDPAAIGAPVAVFG